MKSREAEQGQVAVYGKVVLLAGYLYLFLLSIDMMGTSMKMFGKGFSENLISSTSNPLVGLFVGILATAIIQSSSTTTSIVVGLVGGGALTPVTAIPIVMGANIGTSVTSILVSLANMNLSSEFRRSFAASIVHDFSISWLSWCFSLCSTTPISWVTPPGSCPMSSRTRGGLSFLNPVKAITKPVVIFISGLVQDTGWALLLVALLFLFIALRQMVATLRTLVLKKAESLFDRVLFKTAFRAFIVGLVLTCAVQSSSITVSLVVPLAGAGLLTLAQIFPFTLGANVGTTITALLASLVTGQIFAVQVAFAHVLFNVFGIAIWYPFKRVPISMAEGFANMTTGNKILPIAYIIVAFFVIPGILIFVLR